MGAAVKGSAFTPVVGSVVYVYSVFGHYSKTSGLGVDIIVKIMAVIPATVVPDKAVMDELFKYELQRRAAGLPAKTKIPTRASAHTRIVGHTKTARACVFPLTDDFMFALG